MDIEIKILHADEFYRTTKPTGEMEVFYFYYKITNENETK